MRKHAIAQERETYEGHQQQPWEARINSKASQQPAEPRFQKQSRFWQYHF
jgi:hypothetical protein